MIKGLFAIGMKGSGLSLLVISENLDTTSLKSKTICATCPGMIFILSCLPNYIFLRE